jgi:hypothetical protein
MARPSLLAGARLYGEQNVLGISFIIDFPLAGVADFFLDLIQAKRFLPIGIVDGCVAFGFESFDRGGAQFADTV